MVSRRDFLRLTSGTVLAKAFPNVAQAESVRIYAGRAFASSWRLVLPDTRDAAMACSLIEKIVARTDLLMSPYRPDSEVTQFNQYGTVRVSRETNIVVHRALEIARESGGAFDPTMAPLARRFGFGPFNIAPSRPVGRYGDLKLIDHFLSSTYSGLSIDLCGIAKGFALDEIVHALDGLDFLVELGGEVAARGRHPSGRPWHVGIERPGSAELHRVIKADRRAFATSGTATQGYAVAERRYSHLMDPRNQEPVANGVVAVTVLAETGLIADALATAGMILGPEASKSMLSGYDASALFLVQQPSGIEEVVVNRFPVGSV